MIKNWQIIASAVVAMLAIAGVLGFNSPQSAMAEARQDIKSVSKRVDGHDIKFAVQDEKMNYIMDGIDDLRGLGAAERKAKRKRRSAE